MVRERKQGTVKVSCFTRARAPTDRANFASKIIQTFFKKSLDISKNRGIIYL